MKKWILGVLALSLLLCGCNKQVAVPTEPKTETDTPAVTVPQALEELFTDRDYETTEDKIATITLNGATATADTDAVKISGTTVTITDEGCYQLSGTLENGPIVVDADKQDKTRLILNGVSVTNTTTAPLYIAQADKVFVTLQGENTLVNTTGFSVDNIDGVVFSKDDVTFNGTGCLTVSSAAHGIVSKDELTVTGGKFDLTTASHGVAGKDNVCIDGGSFAIAAGKDGIHSENNDDATLGFVYIKSGSFTVSCEGDGISAAAWMQLDGGEYDIVAGGGSENGQKQQSDNWGGIGGGMGPGGMGGGMRPGKPGMGRTGDATVSNTSAVGAAETTDSTSIKGIKSGGDMVINGGTFTVNSADDAIHSNGSMTVKDGTFTVATGDDGFHAEDTLQIAGGTVTISESYEGLEALHVQVTGGDITLTASDDGLNAAGGTDQSGMGGRDQFGGMGGGKGGRGGFGGMRAGNGSIVISGGKLHVTASGDGLDANGTLEITGGDTIVCGPTRGDTATLDYDTTAVISGGTFIGTGASGMAQSFSDAKQGLIALNVGNMSAGTKITVTDSAGKELLSHTPALDFAVVILSSPEMQKGESYTLTIGTVSDTVTAE